MLKKNHLSEISFIFRMVKRNAAICIFLFLFCFESLALAMLVTKKGEVPHDFTLEDLDGRDINLFQKAGGNPTIVVFWKLLDNKAFIDYSLDELKYLQKYYKKYHQELGLEILGVYVPASEGDVTAREMERIRRLVKNHGISFPILIDNGLNVYKEYGVIALPSTVMIGRSGRVKFTSPGFPLSYQPVVTKQIASLMETERNDADRSISEPIMQLTKK